MNIRKMKRKKFVVEALSLREEVVDNEEEERRRENRTMRDPADD